jgi:hypothetical protein
LEFAEGEEYRIWDPLEWSATGPAQRVIRGTGNNWIQATPDSGVIFDRPGAGLLPAWGAPRSTAARPGSFFIRT